jgi:F0F1-type ATP synthase membrane subunit b/b'
LIAHLLRILIIGVALLAPVYAQEETSAAQREEEQVDRLLVWKWINFGILVAGLGYVIAKTAPGFFNARTSEIQKAIKDATGLKVEADFRASEMDRRMATLSAEVQKLRDAAHLELEREKQRIEEETQTALARIHESTHREIDALRQHAAHAVREQAILLASQLAISRLRERPDQVNQSELVRSFSSHLLEQGRS